MPGNRAYEEYISYWLPGRGLSGYDAAAAILRGVHIRILTARAFSRHKKKPHNETRLFKASLPIRTQLSRAPSEYWLKDAPPGGDGICGEQTEAECNLPGSTELIGQFIDVIITELGKQLFTLRLKINSAQASVMLSDIVQQGAPPRNSTSERGANSPGLRRRIALLRCSEPPIAARYICSQL